ncbi:hypothetical protein AB1L42_19315 [Thalassoglobus sp. JC818]|uniref:hypothetical protein n=1 Tax=Thalassoglobus sp. JC818 TaxID=3232136 RepID=UPI0034588371
MTSTDYLKQCQHCGETKRYKATPEGSDVVSVLRKMAIRRTEPTVWQCKCDACGKSSCHSRRTFTQSEVRQYLGGAE